MYSLVGEILQRADNILGKKHEFVAENFGFFPTTNPCTARTIMYTIDIVPCCTVDLKRKKDVFLAVHCRKSKSV